MTTQDGAPSRWANLPISLRAVIVGFLITLAAVNVWPLLLLNHWRTVRRARRSDIPGAFSLVDRRRRSSTHNACRPRRGVPPWQAIA